MRIMISALAPLVVFCLVALSTLIYSSVALRPPVPDTYAAPEPIELKTGPNPALVATLAGDGLSGDSLSGYALTLPALAPTSLGTLVEDNITSIVSTDSPAGYITSLKSTNANTCLVHSDALSTPNLSTIGCTGVAANQKLMSISASTPHASLPVNRWAIAASAGTGPVTASWLPVTTANTTIATTATAATDDITTIAVGARADMTLLAGDYTGAITITTIAKLPPPPVIAGVSPSTGATTGGDTIMIAGNNLETAYQVFIDLDRDGVEDANELCSDPWASGSMDAGFSCTVPPATAGTYDVVVKTWGGETKSATSPPANTAIANDDFTYVVMPPNYEGKDVTSVDPDTCIDGVVVGTTFTVRDTRGGGQDYRIRCMEDGQYWMISNLKLGSTSGPVPLTPANTNIVRNWSLPQISASSLSYTQSEIYGPVAGQSNDITGNYFYGYLYNWCAATAGGTGGGTNSNTCTAQGTMPAAATGDICPAGWRLPTGGTGNGSNDFVILSNAMVAAHPGSTAAGNFMPTSYFRATFSGHWNGNPGGQGTYGSWWTRSINPSDSRNAFALEVQQNGSVDMKHVLYRSDRFAVRCLMPRS